ncbi:MAG TPA: chemotaxis protein CheX [Bryobacteraceae bacterium]|nr:chemotaxis protein CheX [Bryobacteraceae bacterium]
MNLNEIIVQSLTQSTIQVFSTMLGVEIQCGDTTVNAGMPEANEGVVSFIGVAGSWAGTGSVSCTPAMACRICAQMLMCEAPAVNEEVLDTVAELTNMIIGSVKTELEQHLGPLGLSIPTVVYGRNFKTKSAGNAEWIVMHFQWDGEDLVVKLCLEPKEQAAHVMFHTSSTDACALDV